MQSRNKKLDLFFLVLLAIVLAGVPLGISYYNNYASSQHLPAEAKMLTLTGHSERGWVIGEVTAVDVISFWQKQGQPVQNPVLEVKKDDAEFSRARPFSFRLKPIRLAPLPSPAMRSVATSIRTCRVRWWLKPNSFPAIGIYYIPG
jgi:hypothetical protein